MDMRLARQSAFPLHRHFLLLAENAGCILQAARKTNLSQNKEVKEQNLKCNPRSFVFVTSKFKMQDKI